MQVLSAGGYTLNRQSGARQSGASRRISERDGMRVIATEERDHVGGRFLSETWEMSRGAWRGPAGPGSRQ